MARFPSIVSSSRRQTVAFFCISIAALVKFAMRKIEFVVSLEFLQNVEKQLFGCSSRIFWINCSHMRTLSLSLRPIFFSFLAANCCLTAWSLSIVVFLALTNVITLLWFDLIHLYLMPLSKQQHSSSVEKSIKCQLSKSGRFIHWQVFRP